MAQAHIAVRPPAPEPDPGAGVEADRAAKTILLFRAWREDADEAVRAVQAAVDSHLIAAGTRPGC